MDQEKLARLRARYDGQPAESITNPLFRRVSEFVFSSPGERRKPWAGMPTLLDFPAADGPEGLDIALIGVPMDLGVTNRSGARFGPRAMRGIERIGPYNHALGIVPGAHARIADLGDVPFRSRYSLSQSIEDIQAYYEKIRDAGVRALSVGGDHSITAPIMAALGADRPLGMVHIDAHCDTGGETEGEKFHHGGPFRQAVLAGVLDPDRSIQIGIRGSSEFLWEFSTDAGMTVIHAEDVDRLGIDAIVSKAREVVGDGPVYVTLDVDGIDPAYTPGTGTPEAGGLTPRETQRLLRGLAGLEIIGGDVVEIAPQYDPGYSTVLTGAQMLFEILCLMVARDAGAGADSECTPGTAAGAGD